MTDRLLLISLSHISSDDWYRIQISRVSPFPMYGVYELYFSRNNIGSVTEMETRPSMPDLLISVKEAVY
jgi:hypothetical protein